MYTSLVESAKKYEEDLPIKSESKSVQILSDVAILGQKILCLDVIVKIILMSEGSNFKA